MMNTQPGNWEQEIQQLMGLAENFSGLRVERNLIATRELRLEFDLSTWSDFDPSKKEWVPGNTQQIELVIPVSYPADPPQMRWLTPIYHPNISASGYLDCSDIGLHWSEAMSLILVVERLWDISRYAWVDREAANHYSARRHWETDPPEAPTDNRQLSINQVIEMQNVISYRVPGSDWKGARVVEPSREIDPTEDVIRIEDSGTSGNETDSAESEISGQEKHESIPIEIVDDSKSTSLPEVFVIDDKNAVPPVVRSDDDDVIIIE